MRHYQRQKDNPYKLPHNVYMQCLYLIRDYDRLKKLLHNTPQDEPLYRAAFERCESIEQALLTVPYVSRMQERGRSAAYIKTEMSAIRLFHDLIPNPRYKLPSNDSLSLERRRFGEIDRTWTDQEYEGMKHRADLQGRGDFSDMLTLIRHTGLRLHECARLDTAAVEGAIRINNLTVKGKGGKVRSVPINAKALEVLRRRADIIKRGCKLFVPDGVKTDAVMSDLEQFITRNRNDDRENGVHLTVHGLRHTWAAERYRELIASGRTPYEARRQVSRWLGHERDSVTKIYLASLKNGKKGGGRP